MKNLEFFIRTRDNENFRKCITRIKIVNCYLLFVAMTIENMYAIKLLAPKTKINTAHLFEAVKYPNIYKILYSEIERIPYGLLNLLFIRGMPDYIYFAITCDTNTTKYIVRMSDIEFALSVDDNILFSQLYQLSSKKIRNNAIHLLQVYDCPNCRDH